MSDLTVVTCCTFQTFRGKAVGTGSVRVCFEDASCRRKLIHWIHPCPAFDESVVLICLFLSEKLNCSQMGDWDNEDGWGSQVSGGPTLVVLSWGVFDCTANFGSSLHPPQTASTADSSCNRTALPQVLPETRDIMSCQNKTNAGFREVRHAFAFQSKFCRVLTRVLCQD